MISNEHRFTRAMPPSRSPGQITSLLFNPTVEWYWKCLVKPICLKVGAVMALVMSILVIWSEITFFRCVSQHYSIFSTVLFVTWLLQKYCCGYINRLRSQTGLSCSQSLKKCQLWKEILVHIKLRELGWWAHSTYFSIRPTLSVFAAVVKAAGRSHSYVVIEAVSFLTVFYLCLCTYFTIFKVKFTLL